jgi:hypothetical protein
VLLLLPSFLHTPIDRNEISDVEIVERIVCRLAGIIARN